MRKPRICSRRRAFFAVRALAAGWMLAAGRTLAAGLALAAALSACRGCDRPPPPAAALEAVPADTRRSDLLARFADLKIDRSHVYPKDQRGVVTCGDDIRCFVAQAESCTRAEVTSKITDSGYGIHNVVEALYTLEGSEPNVCRLSRRLLKANSYFDGPLLAAMRSEGKSELDVDQVQTEASERLRRRTAARLDCSFTNDDVLEATIDLAHQLFNDKLFRLNCRESNVAAQPLQPMAGARDAAVAAAPEEPAASKP